MITCEGERTKPWICFCWPRVWLVKMPPMKQYKFILWLFSRWTWPWQLLPDPLRPQPAADRAARPRRPCPDRQVGQARRARDRRASGRQARVAHGHFLCPHTHSQRNFWVNLQGDPSRLGPGLVDFDFGGSTICSILFGLMRYRQSSWLRWVEHQNQRHPNPGLRRDWPHCSYFLN